MYKTKLIYFTYEESYSAANSIAENFLYNSRGLDVINLLVKYYVPLAHRDVTRNSLRGPPASPSTGGP